MVRIILFAVSDFDAIVSATRYFSCLRSVLHLRKYCEQSRALSAMLKVYVVYTSSAWRTDSEAMIFS